ncbi:MAG: IS3 family transposase [Saprospiraceae bacterium]|nr:IS3 family transposase [Saprospiraceae bacterium]
MVKPSAKRMIVTYLIKKYNASVDQSVSIVNMSRSSWYYKSKVDDSEIVSKLEQMVEKYPNRGFENYYHRIRREGKKWAWCRILRVYREMGLVRRVKKRFNLPDAQRKPLQQPDRHNETWSMDFMSDSLVDGRKFRILNILDDYNRECLVSEGSISFPAKRVIDQLERLKEDIGLPSYIRTDNGPEFTSNDYKEWCKKNEVTPVYAEPGKPTQNGYIERLNRTFREDVLDAYMFNSINQFNIISEKWKNDYNEYHPHQSLGHMSPKEYAPRVFNSFNNEKSLRDFSSLKCEKLA